MGRQWQAPEDTMSIPVETARPMATQRIVQVLRHETFAANLERISALLGLPRAPRAPESEYILRTDPDRPEVIEGMASDVFVFVWPDDSTDFGEETSSGAGVYTQETTTDFNILLAFMIGPEDQPQALSATAVNKWVEHMRLKAECYMGALGYQILKYAQDGEAIHSVHIERNDSLPVLDEDQLPVMYTTHLVVRVLQILTLPDKTALP
jgi:hypothetical protein